MHIHACGAAFAAIVFSGLAGCTSGLDDRRSADAVPNTGSINATAYAPAQPPRGASGWSGQSGASGHADMDADVIRAAAADFPQCLNRLWPQAQRRGVSRAAYERLTAGLTPDLKLMDLMDSQPEFTKAMWDYLDLLVSESRIQTGREMLQTHKATFDAIERTYGVDRHVIAAIWGVETKYGAISGDRSVIRSTATLACIGRRKPFFTEEFLAAIEIVARGDLRAESFKGSWAGAFGATQFMPSTFKSFAIDFDGDGRRDTVGTVADAMASTANKLKKQGWRSGQPWGYEVVVPKGFDYLMADRSRELTIAQWQRLGLARPGGKAFPQSDARAYLLTPAGARGPSFLMLENFRVIMKYNPAEAYALAIGHLADRMQGGGPFVQAWPRDEAVLSRSDRRELQEQLARRGYDIGEPDGRLGTKTRLAIRQYQSTVGLPPDGFASGAVLTRLRQ